MGECIYGYCELLVIVASPIRVYIGTIVATSTVLIVASTIDESGTVMSAIHRSCSVLPYRSVSLSLSRSRSIAGAVEAMGRDVVNHGVGSAETNTSEVIWIVFGRMRLNPSELPRECICPLSCFLQVVHVSITILYFPHDSSMILCSNH